jgi:hypothetical protein
MMIVCARVTQSPRVMTDEPGALLFGATAPRSVVRVACLRQNLQLVWPRLCVAVRRLAHEAQPRRCLRHADGCAWRVVGDIETDDAGQLVYTVTAHATSPTTGLTTYKLRAVHIRSLSVLTRRPLCTPTESHVITDSEFGIDLARGEVAAELRALRDIVASPAHVARARVLAVAACAETDGCAWPERLVDMLLDTHNQAVCFCNH